MATRRCWSSLTTAFLVVSWVGAGVVDGLVLQVCQNKDCARPFQRSTVNLPDTFHQLLPTNADNLSIQVTGCLGHCGQGPNVGCSKVASDKAEATLMDYTGAIATVSDAAKYLQGTMGVTVPKELLAATKVLDKAYSCKFIVMD
jgi:hypothetical protein